MADRLPPGQGALQNWNNINSNKPEEYSSEFVIDGIKYANVTNVSTGQRQLYFVQSISGARGAPIMTTNADGTRTPGGNYDNFNRNNPGKLAAAEAANKQASVKLLSTPGVSTPAESAAIKNSKEFKSTSVGNNAATNSPAPDGQAGTPPTSTQSAAAAAESATTKEGTRKSYSDDMKYPITLKSEVQDVIKFSILEYSPSLAKENQGADNFGSTKSRVVTLEGNNPVVKGSKKIGTITLPIPAGISDGNTAGWQSGDLNMLQSETANFAKGFFEGGVDGAGKAAESTAGKIPGASASGELQTAVKSIFLDNLTQANVTS